MLRAKGLLSEVLQIQIKRKKIIIIIIEKIYRPGCADPKLHTGWTPMSSVEMGTLRKLNSWGVRQPWGMTAAQAGINNPSLTVTAASLQLHSFAQTVLPTAVGRCWAMKPQLQLKVCPLHPTQVVQSPGPRTPVWCEEGHSSQRSFSLCCKMLL